MKLSCFLPTPHLESIQKQTLDLINLDGYQVVASRYREIDYFLKEIPSLTNFLDDCCLRDCLDIVFLMGTDPGCSSHLHIDQSNKLTAKLSLNIPIQGTFGTEMRWYRTTKVLRNVEHRYYGTYPVFESGQIIHSVELTEPCLCRTDVPHDVINPTTQQRIILSLRFTKDPCNLIE